MLVFKVGATLLSAIPLGGLTVAVKQLLKKHSTKPLQK